MRIPNSEIRRQAELALREKNTTISIGSRMVAQILIRLCDELEDVDAELQKSWKAYAELKSATGRESANLEKVLHKSSPATIYWLKGEHVMCRYCKLVKGSIDAGVEHEETCPIVIAVAAMPVTFGE